MYDISHLFICLVLGFGTQQEKLGSRHTGWKNVGVKPATDSYSEDLGLIEQVTRVRFFNFFPGVGSQGEDQQLTRNVHTSSS
ncbi:hypothetical protein ACFX13_019227 [Malus domestica]